MSDALICDLGTVKNLTPGAHHFDRRILSEFKEAERVGLLAAAKFNSDNGYDHLTKCIACLPGYYTNKTEQRFCLRCDAGKYSDKIGMHLCKDCPNGFFQGSKRSVLCNNKNTCSSEKSEINKVKTECIKPEWKTPSDCTTDVQYLNDAPLNRSRWACQDCFPGADCSGHRRWQEVTPKLGFRQMSYDNFTFGKCLNAKACNNNNGQNYWKQQKKKKIFP